MNNEKVTEIVFEGRKYFKRDNSWYDETSIIVPKALVQKLDQVKTPVCVRIIENPDDLTVQERKRRKMQLEKQKQINKKGKAETNQKNDIYDHAFRLPGDRYRK